MLTIYSVSTANFGKELVNHLLFFIMTSFILVFLACAVVAIIGTLLYIIYYNMISLLKSPKKYKN